MREARVPSPPRVWFRCAHRSPHAGGAGHVARWLTAPRAVRRVTGYSLHITHYYAALSIPSRILPTSSLAPPLTYSFIRYIYDICAPYRYASNVTACGCAAHNSAAVLGLCLPFPHPSSTNITDAQCFAPCGSSWAVIGRQLGEAELRVAPRRRAKRAL